MISQSPDWAGGGAPVVVMGAALAGGSYSFFSGAADVSAVGAGSGAAVAAGAAGGSLGPQANSQSAAKDKTSPEVIFPMAEAFLIRAALSRGRRRELRNWSGVVTMKDQKHNPTAREVANERK